MKALMLNRECSRDYSMVSNIWLCLLLLLIFTMNSAKAAVINHSGTISTNEVWSSSDVHRIISTVTINAGAELTIQPGSIIKFDQTTSLNVYGTLTATGTVTEQIIFTSSKDDSIGGDTNGDLVSSGAPGDWSHLYFEGSSSSISSLEYVEVRYGGDGAVYTSGSSVTIANNLVTDSAGAGIYCNGGSPQIQDNEISSSGGVGIYVNSGTPTISRNSVNDGGSYGIYYAASNTVPPLDNNTLQGNYRAARIPVSALPIDAATNNTIVGNQFNHIEIHGGTLTHNALMAENDIYYLLGSLTVSSVATLNINAGVIVKLEKNAGLYVFGALEAKGQVDSKIVFTSRFDDSAGGDTNGDGDSSGAPGDWEEIEFDSEETVTSILDYVEVRFAWQPIDSTRSNISITNSIIRDYSSSIAIINSSALIKGNTIEGGDYLGLYIYLDEAKTIDVVDNIIRNNVGSGVDIQLWGQAAVNFSGNVISEHINSYSIGGQYGVLVRGDGTLLMNNNTLTGNTFPIAIDMSVLPALINGNNSINDNAHNAIAILAGTLNQDLTLPGNQVYVFPYHRTYNNEPDATIGVGATLTLQPGTVLKFDNNKSLNVRGVLQAIGANSAVEKIIFTSLSDDSVGGDSEGDGTSIGQLGDWRLLNFFETAGASKLNNVEIRFASRGIHHYSVNHLSVINSHIHHSEYYGVSARGGGTFELRDSTISNNGGNGVYIDYGTIPTITGNTITGNGDAGIYFDGINTADTIPMVANNVIQENFYPGEIPFSALPDPGNANSVKNNTHNDLYLLGGALTNHAVLTIGNNYWFLGDAVVDTGAQLTIEPGVILKSDSTLTINGSLQAIGTETAPIIFTADTDDSIGNQKAWYDKTFIPRNGDWGGLQFNASAAPSELNYTKVRYAGANGVAAINMQTAMSVENSVISNSAAHGINIDNVSPLIDNNQIWGNTFDGIHIVNNAANPILSNNQISSNLSDGIELEGGAEALVNNNLIFMNREYGLRNSGSALINATENWWGDFNDSGPHHAIDNIDAEGNSVSDNVDYSAYLAPEDGIECRYDNFSETAGTAYGIDTLITSLTQGELSDEWDLIDKQPDRTMAWDSHRVEIDYSGLDPSKQYRIRVSYYNGDNAESLISLNDSTGKFIHRVWEISKLQAPTQYEFTIPRSYYTDGAITLVFNRDNASIATRVAVPEIWLLEGAITTTSSLVDIEFNDLDGSYSLSPGDEYYFHFSDVINTSLIASGTHPDTFLIPENSLSFGSDSSMRWIGGDTTAIVKVGSDFTIAGSELIATTGLKDILNNDVVGSDFLSLIDTVGPLFTNLLWQDNDNNGFLSLGDHYEFYFSDSVYGVTQGIANIGFPPENRSYGNVNQISWSADSKIATITVTEGYTIIGNEIVYPTLTGSNGESIRGSHALTGRETNQPLLNSIDFDDINGDDQLSAGDQFIFKFSEPMLTTAFTSANADLKPETKSYGDTDQFNWNPEDTELRVYLTNGFSVQGSEMISVSDQVMDRSENLLANTGTLNSLDTQAPEIVSSYGSVSGPVPLDSDYQISVKFNTSMDADVDPIMTITDAGGTILNVASAGTWSTTTHNNDTYTSSAIALTQELSGPLRVNISAASDVAGNVMAPVDGAYTFYRQLITPTVTNYLLAPEVNTVASETITLEGTRDNDSSIWINGSKKVDIGSGDWSVQFTLAQGDSDIIVVAKDAAGNATPAQTFKFYLDTIAPILTSTIPIDAIHTNINPGVITLNFIEAGSGLDLEKSQLSVTGNSSVIVGDWSSTIGVLTFTPQLGFIEGTYQINAQIFDNVNLSSNMLVSTFTYDKTPPVAPVISTFPTVTNNAVLVVSGTKEAYSSVWFNGINIVGNTANTTWSYSLILNEGANALSFTARDRANNESPAAVASVKYDNTPPGSVLVTGVGEGNGNSAKANLDWSTYNEMTNGGDIDHYEIFINTRTYTNTGSASITGTTVSGVKAYTVTGLVASIDYYIAVVAVDTSGNRLSAVAPILIDAIDSTSPEEVSNITIASTENSLIIGWDHSADSAGDLAGYKLVIDNNPAIEIPATQNNYTQNGLAPAKAYTIRITAIDNSDNESTGGSVTGITLLNNPTALTGISKNGLVELNWVASTPGNLVKNYAIYFAETAFTSVAAMTPAVFIDAGSSSAVVAGLTNDTAYYFAVTAINLSGGELKSVNPSSFTPSADSAGPEFLSVLYNGAALVDNAILTQSGNLVVNATDTSGVSKIEFLLDNVKLGEDVNQVDGFSSNLDILAITDGAHTLGFIAYDSLNNSSQHEIPVDVVLAPPAAPTLIKTQDGTITNQTQVSVSGHSVKSTLIQFYNNAAPLGSEIANDVKGDFIFNVDLNEDINELSATARYLDGRGGVSAESNTITITVDSSIPDTPTGLFASSLADGFIKLTWNQTNDSEVAGYDLYRATKAFTDLNQAQKVNTEPIITSSFSDLPEVDGNYFYRVVSVNQLSTPSALSTHVEALSDRTAPEAVKIEYNPAGNFDADSGRMAPGQVSVSVTVSEALLTTPFLNISPDGGAPLTVNLNKLSDTEYNGSFTISEATATGTAIANFSARDKVGNRGTAVVSGAVLKIDTDGPVITGLTVAPDDPIKNDQSSPVDVNFTLQLDELVADSNSMQIRYLLSGEGRAEQNVSSSLIQTEDTLWWGNLTLPADAGLQQAESLSFIYQGLDDLGNSSTQIQSHNGFQVYQGDLPPLPIPEALTAIAKPAGQVLLNWQAVTGAASYQLYRQAPNETESSVYIRINNTQFLDDTAEDGEYSYRIASVRLANDQEGLSAPSEAVNVIADSYIPESPSNLNLALNGSGVLVDWLAPEEPELSYRLYRSEISITEIDGLNPIVSGIDETSSRDADPNTDERYYAVTAVDGAGNESIPSASAYQNVELLPVSSLKVEQKDNEAPVVSWNHNSNTIAGYNLYISATGNSVSPVNNGLLTAFDYIDTGYANNTRFYKVVAVDNADVQSIGRSVILPEISLELSETSKLQRGVINQLDYRVHNLASYPLSNVTVNITVSSLDGSISHTHSSLPFDLAAGEDHVVPVVFGGYNDLPDDSFLTSRLLIAPDSGEKVTIEKNGEIAVTDNALVVSLATQEMTRGVDGKVRFSIENTSTVETEIVVAQGGQSSSEIRVKLLDTDGNLLTSQPIKQNLGSQVVQLANGKTVARIAPGSEFTSDWFDVPIPLSAPTGVIVAIEIDHYHYRLGQSDQVTTDGAYQTQATELIDTSYYGELSAISPQISDGDENIMINGQALSRSNGTSLPTTPLTLIINANGFKRSFDIYTDSQGQFSYEFKPLSGESGSYKVSVIHPDVQDQPEQGQFVINRLTLDPTLITLKIPYNYEQAVSINASAKAGDDTVKEIRLDYRAEDQDNGELPAGIAVNLGSAIQISSGQNKQLGFTVKADTGANVVGSLKLNAVRVYRDSLGSESSTELIEQISVNYAFADALPVLQVTPTILETGVSQQNIVNETLAINNKGLATLENINIVLLNEEGSPAPEWVSLTSPAQPEDLPVGQNHSVGISASPTSTIVDGTYLFTLRISASNYQMLDIPVVIHVLQSGMGQALFKISDIYTATTNSDGELIEGLSSANIFLQNELVSAVTYSLTSDSTGEALFTDISAGFYKFRVSANNHQDVIGRLTIKPGVTLSQDVFLDYNLVTIEWSVTEITLTDSYDITLSATFETDVPAAVVIAEPSNITLPDMAAGAIYQGEFMLTNYGLVRADNLVISLPSDDQYFRYELMEGTPDSLDAKESITLAYRVTALKALDPAIEGGDSLTGVVESSAATALQTLVATANGESGSNCYAYSKPIKIDSDYECANGTRTKGSANHYLTKTYGQCNVSESSNNPIQVGTELIIFNPDDGGGGGNTYTPVFESISGAQCIPRPKDCPTCEAPGTLFGGDQ